LKARLTAFKAGNCFPREHNTQKELDFFREAVKNGRGYF
jgi:hypothetical protein